MMENIERCLGLHESLKVVYVVDGFEAAVVLADGAIKGASAKAPTVFSAVAALNGLLAGHDWATLRKRLANTGVNVQNHRPKVQS